MPAAVHTQRFYPTQQFPQPRSHPSAHPIPSPLFAQTFYPQMHAPAGAHPSQHHHSRFGSHSRPRYHSHSPPAQYAQGPVSVPVQVNYSSQSRTRRGSTGDGPRVADFHINPALAYPSHSHSDPRYIQAKSILRNRGGPPPAPVHPPPRERRVSFHGMKNVLSRRGSAPPPPIKQVKFREMASLHRF